MGSLEAKLDLSTLFIRWQDRKAITLNPLIKLLERSSNLLHLTVANIKNDEPIDELLATISRCLPQLESLSLFKDDNPKVRPIIIKEFLETCSSKLETLTIAVDCTFDNDIIKEDLVAMNLLGPLKGSKSHPKLKLFHFAVDDWLDLTESIIPAILMTFIEGCPNLEIVDYWMCEQSARTPWMLSHESIATLVRKILGIHVLKRFLNTSSDYDKGITDDIELAKAILNLRIRDNGMQEIWQSIDLEVVPEPWSAMPKTSQAIAKAATIRGLQKIYVEFAEGMPSQDIENILHHGRELRMFRSFHFPKLIIKNPSSLLLPWNCRWMRSLYLEFGGIPRPDVLIDYRGQSFPQGTPLHSGTMEESRQVQQRIYDLLAGLKCLEELFLGKYTRQYWLVFERSERGRVYYDKGFQSECLEMSLESGMGVLSCLKAMQYLRVENMEHRIGERELWWMQANWPNLTSVIGVTNNRFSPGALAGRKYGSDDSLKQCGVSFIVE
ncbi:hypothetical protein FBU30_001976 [Linnemannia zychae]|nr:hypothetical protein FBU30_001976 [Linnemannia zychae]